MNCCPQLCSATVSSRVIVSVLVFVFPVKCFNVLVWYGVDYDLQVALMEALCRMTSRAQRRELADQWFGMEFVASAFTKIQDSEFETVSDN